MTKDYGRLSFFMDHFDDDDWGFGIAIGKTEQYFTFQINFYRRVLDISWERRQ